MLRIVDGDRKCMSELMSCILAARLESVSPELRRYHFPGIRLF